MTSMIDVVFLLLIYFLTTTALWQTEQELNPATRVEQTGPSSEGADIRPLIIDVVDGAGGGGYRVGLRSISTLQELREVIRQYPNKSGGAFVRVADDAPFAMAAAAVHACKAENFWPVTYLPAEQQRE
jgi:biopolymer transport protein ExbD